jgi:ubiquinone/menaquinone biosynthesis C-methylase UbiE
MVHILKKKEVTMTPKPHVCPVWIGYFLAHPIRKLFHNPMRILASHIKPGMTVLDVGCAMGFFTIPAAEMVGKSGRVIAVDLQPKMLEKLKKRAAKAKVADRIETRACQADSVGLLDLESQVDVVLAIAMVHETPNPENLIAELSRCLKPEGRLLVAEPRGHVSDAAFGDTLGWAADAGLTTLSRPKIGKTHSAWLTKPAVSVH